MRAGRVNARVARGVGALQSVQREGGDKVRRLVETQAAVERERAERRRELRPVDEREPLLRLEHGGCEARRPQRLRGRAAPSVPVHLPFPDEREREVRERSEISRGADRALLGNDGVNSRRKAREEKLQRLSSDARKPFARQFARSSITARTAGAESGAPVPAAWLLTRLSWSAPSFSLGMTTSANFPNPVVTP